MAPRVKKVVRKCGASPCLVEDEDQLMGSPSLTPITMVAKLIDGYIAEVAPDVNLILPKFQALAAAVPDYARPLDDGLYRAIDIYLKCRPWLAEADREQLCRLMDCQKLSMEACTHAAQNERLPLRVIVQVLFFEQLQPRTSIAGCFLVSDNLDGGSRQLRSGIIGHSNEGGGGWATAVRENQVLNHVWVVLYIFVAFMSFPACGVLGAILMLYVWTMFGNRRLVAPEELTAVHPVEYEYKKINIVCDEALKDDGKK